MNVRNLLTRRRLFTILICGAIGAYAGWVGSHRPLDVNTTPPSPSSESTKELTQKLVQELVKLRDNIDRGITPEELKKRTAAIRDVHLTMIFNHNPISNLAKDKMRDVVKALHEGSELKDLRAKTELAITALSVESPR